MRDSDGRTYAAASVKLESFSIEALPLAVAMAVSSGAKGLEAGVVVSIRADRASFVPETAPHARVSSRSEHQSAAADRAPPWIEPVEISRPRGSDPYPACTSTGAPSCGSSSAFDPRMSAAAMTDAPTMPTAAAMNVAE